MDSDIKGFPLLSNRAYSLETLALYGFPKLAEIYSQTRSKCLEGSSFSFEEL